MKNIALITFLFVLIFVHTALAVESSPTNNNLGPDTGGAYQYWIRTAHGKGDDLLIMYKDGNPTASKFNLGFKFARPDSDILLIEASTLDSDYLIVGDSYITYHPGTENYYALLSLINLATRKQSIYLLQLDYSLKWVAYKIDSGIGILRSFDILRSENYIYGLFSKSTKDGNNLCVSRFNTSNKKLEISYLAGLMESVGEGKISEVDGTMQIVYLYSNQIFIRDLKGDLKFGSATKITSLPSYVTASGIFQIVVNSQYIFLAYPGQQKNKAELLFDIYLTKALLINLKSWSEPRVVNNSGPANTNQLHPSMFCGGGKLSIIWADFGQDGDEYSVKGVSSQDNGETFGEILQISELPSFKTLLLGSDTSTLSTNLNWYNGKFIALWADTRNGPSDIYGAFFE